MSVQKAFNTLKRIHGKLPKNKNYNTDYAKIHKTLEPHAPYLLDAFKKWDVSLKTLDASLGVSDEQPYHYIILAIAELTDEELPEWFIPYVQRLCALQRLSLANRVRPFIAQLPEEMILEQMLRKNVRGNWNSNLCLTLLDLIKDEEALDRVLDLVILDTHTALSFIDEETGFKTTYSPGLSDDGVRRLAYSGTVVRMKLESYMAPDIHVDTARPIMMLARHINSPESAKTYVTALAHKSKEIQSLAMSALGYLDARARPALEEGTKAKKKSAREFCTHLLSLLPDQALADPFLELDDHARHAIITRIYELHILDEKESALTYKDKAPKRWKTFFDEEAATNPRLYICALSSVYFADLDGARLFRVMMKHEAFADMQVEGWMRFIRAYVQTFVKDAYSINMEEKELDRMPQSYRGNSVVAAMPTGFGTMMVKLLPFYLRVCGIKNSDIYMNALTYPSKSVRESAIKYAGRIAFDDISPILAELDDRKKGARLVAAEALFKMPLELITPHVKVLNEHLESEQADEVKGALKSVIARIA